MSYVIIIRRKSGSSLRRAVADKVLAGDSEFRAVGQNTWQWQPGPGGKSVALNWEEDGTLSTDGAPEWTSDEGMGKLRWIAGRLDACVIGEEGEDLSSETGAVASPSSIALLGGLALAVVSLPLMLLLLVVRLPWILWKVVRSAK